MFYQGVMQIRTSDDITSSSFMGNARQLFKNTKSYNNSIKISFEIRYNLKGCFRFTSKFLETNFILNILFRSKSTLPAMGLLHFERKGKEKARPVLSNWDATKEKPLICNRSKAATTKIFAFFSMLEFGDMQTSRKPSNKPWHKRSGNRNLMFETMTGILWSHNLNSQLDAFFRAA